MKGLPVIAIFDVGKTNKKLFLFDQQYNIVFERSARFNEITDEDGNPCENIEALRLSLFDSLKEVLSKNEFDVKAINYSAYGASFVYLDDNGNVIAPLYNYLKKYPESLHEKFYNDSGGETEFAHRTASPVLGSLNSGLQLYRMKYEKPEVFKKIKYALHLPQYLSFLLTRKATSDLTSIGCHTGLWDFTKNDYHEWVEKEEIKDKLPPVVPSSSVFNISYQDHDMISGIGLHDSSAALIPYLVNFKDPFVLLSTGTWNITLNPFNQSPLTSSELQDDCLFYISYKGVPVKASRLFAGYEHDKQMELFAAHFDQPLHFYKHVNYDPSIKTDFSVTGSSFDAAKYENYEEAYHHFIFYLLKKQVASTNLVMTQDVKRIFVDGGFSMNPIFMNMLAAMYPDKEVYAATIAQSTALGAALAIHDEWNRNTLPPGVIDLKYYVAPHKMLS